MLRVLYAPLGSPTAQPNMGSTISGLRYCSVVCLLMSIASASASALFCGGCVAGNVVEPKSHSLKTRGVGRCGVGVVPLGCESTFSIYRQTNSVRRHTLRSRWSSGRLIACIAATACGSVRNPPNTQHAQHTHLAHIREDIEDLNLLQPVAQALVEEVNDAAAWCQLPSRHIPCQYNAPEQNSMRMNTSCVPFGSR